MGLISANNIIAGCSIILIICIIVVIVYVLPGNKTPEDKEKGYKIATWAGIVGGIIAVIMGVLIYIDLDSAKTPVTDPEYARINHLPTADKN